MLASKLGEFNPQLNLLSTRLSDWALIVANRRLFPA